MLNLMLQIVIEVQRDNKPGETNVKMGQKNLLKIEFAEHPSR